ncbi:MAG TPA: DUF1002 domain-containing protein [Tetragenococcus sp.]|nr:DUF1002 domain-containing protein [Tetragenococcus sp.]
MKLKKMIIGLSCLALLVLGGKTVFADNNEKTKDEGWDVPSVALGNGLTQAEQEQTLDELKATDESYNKFIVDGDDLVKYVTDVDSFTSDSKAYSSAYIKRTDEGSGVNVTIETPKNITARTEANYRNAAITSGIYDADIRIASVRVMDGSGALAGIYKIYDEVDPASDQQEEQERAENREVAQKESSVVSDISEENQDKDDYSDDNLAVALANIKLELQGIKDELAKMNESQAKEKVQEVVEKQINKQGLGDVVNGDQINSITNVMYDFSQAPAIDDSEMKSQLTNLKDDLMSNGKDFINNTKEKLTSDESKSFFAGLWEQVTSFFSNLFN